ncbi:MAG TPA: substrate-binding domain-containing protein [Chitinophagaceae bacterium]|nr:substrate-binding domain-containing protein [Chitinophagaceae bacterium]
MFQDFEHDVFNALQQGLQLIQKYKSLHLILGREHFQYVPNGIIKGVTKFCRQEAIPFTIRENFAERNARQQHAYLIFSDTDLIRFIKHCNKMKWRPGRDVGIISYDDTPVKEILLAGVTVISTDFEQMGKTAGRLIAEKRREKIANPCSLIVRKPL